jgi:ribose transport system substrate-binding protein
MNATDRPLRLFLSICLLTCLAAALAIPGCNRDGGTSSGGKPRVAYVPNGPDPFWVIAQKGAEDAAKEFGADLQVIIPNGAVEQKQKVEDVLVRGIDGVAISPIDAANQTPFLNEVAKKTNLITQDSDAPNSNRLMFIGVDNYKAGRMCGQLVKEAVPEGGKVAIFVGRMEQDNARLRRQGLIDELVNRSEDPNRAADPVGNEIKGDKYTVVATLTDQFDRPKARDNAADLLTKHSDLKAMVGLFAYNPPMCLEALRQRNMLGKVQVIGFDEQDATLQAIKDGHCHGTVVQNPYKYGYESVNVLVKLAKGDKSVIPGNKVMDIPARQIRKNNVDEFWTDLKKKLGK